MSETINVPIIKVPVMNVRDVVEMGMPMEYWEHKSCVASFGVGSDWATLYHIESKQPGQGHATAVLQAAKGFYERRGKKFGGTVALNDTMKHIYEKLEIEEYAKW